MLASIPYSIVNLTENLLPLKVNSDVEDIQNIFDQYKSSPECYEVLLVTLQNLTTVHKIDGNEIDDQ